MADKPREGQGTAPGERDERQADAAFACSVAGALGFIAVLYLWLPKIVAMLLLAALLAYALLPTVDRLARRMPRSLAVLLVAAVGVGLITLVVVLFAPAVASELELLPDALKRTAASAAAYWARVRGRMPPAVVHTVESATASVRAAAPGGKPGSAALSKWVTGAAEGVSTVGSAIVFVPIFAFLMLRGYHAFFERIMRLVPMRWTPRFTARTRQADRVLSGFIRGQVVVAAILAAVYGLAFTLIGIPLGLLIGVFAGVGELVPFVGGIIAVLFGSLMALAGGKPVDILWVIGVYVVVQAIQGAVISPLVMGSRVSVGPAAVIVALVVGAQLFGFIGMLLAVPAAAVLKVGAGAALDAYRGSPFFRERAPS